MLKQQARLLSGVVFCMDLMLVAAAFVAAYWARHALLPEMAPRAYPNPLYPLQTYLPLLPLALSIWAVVLVSSGRYRSHRTIPMKAEAWALIEVGAVASLLLTLSIFAFRLDLALLTDDRISRSWIFLFAALATVFLIAEKLALRIISRYVRYRGYNYRTVMIVGVNPTGLDMAQSIESHSQWGLRLLGFVHGDADRDNLGSVPDGVPLLGHIDQVLELVERHVVDDVFFALPRRDLSRLEDVFLGLHQQGIRTRFALNILPHGSAHLQLEELDGMPMLSVSPTPDNVFLTAFKRSVDVGLSVLLLTLGLPIIFLVAGVLRLSSAGTVLYRQERCGLNGRRFMLYKFRTMVENADNLQNEVAHLNEMSGPVFKMKKDPRVTWIGRYLRKFSLDELPQLWNVLRGDMSMVGPRPPIPEEVAKYTRWQRRRLSMKPGLTCLWQVNGRNELDFDRWMELDLEYIDSWSPSLDFKILLKTIPAVLSGRGAS